MLTLIPKTNIDFIKKRYLFFAISITVMVAGTASLILKKGPKWGLDFTGGTLIEVKFENPPLVQEIRKTLTERNIPSLEIQSVAEQGMFIIRTRPFTAKESQGNLDKEIGKEIINTLQNSFPERKPTLLRKEYVGPTVGRHLIGQTGLAFILTFVGIIIYVAFRFRSGVWGTAGVVALIHDVYSTIGLFSLCDKEITVTIVAALLTIAGYSINDTIVIFDFMRERLKLRKAESLAQTINESINTTLSRTIITSLTVFLVVLTLFFFGGEVIHDFAFAMLFGVVIGTYSSIAVAAPMIYEWNVIKSRQKKN